MPHVVYFFSHSFDMYPRRAPIGSWLRELAASHQAPITSCTTFDDCSEITSRTNQLAGANECKPFPVVAKDIYQECIGDFVAVNRFATAFHLNMDGGVTFDVRSHATGV